MAGTILIFLTGAFVAFVSFIAGMYFTDRLKQNLPVVAIPQKQEQKKLVDDYEEEKQWANRYNMHVDEDEDEE